MYSLMYTLMHALYQPSTSNPTRAVRFVGSDLTRPECVLANGRGDFFVSDWAGGVTHIDANGKQQRYLASPVDGITPKPNGIALLADGSFLLAHLGNDEGGVYRLDRSGHATPWLLEVDGRALPPTNYVVQDAMGRTWITVSTRLKPRASAYNAFNADGFVVCVTATSGARIVADGLGYTNECAVHPNGRWLYVNETFSRRLSRFSLKDDGSLGRKEIVTTFGKGVYPDGLAFDETGAAWVVSIVSNSVIRIDPDGAQTVWLQDADVAHVAWVEAAYHAGTMGRPHLDNAKGKQLANISSIAFCGADRKTAALGCLQGKQLALIDVPHAGAAPFHWNFG
jgi:sugar lactone lactonase YvrE